MLRDRGHPGRSRPDDRRGSLGGRQAHDQLAAALGGCPRDRQFAGRQAALTFSPVAGGGATHYIPPADACNTCRAMLAGLAELEADTHQHVHKKNNILFLKAIAAEARLDQCGV